MVVAAETARHPAPEQGRALAPARRWRQVLSRTAAWVQPHPGWAIFVLALGIRLIAAIVIAVVHKGFLIPDEIQYVLLGRQAANGQLGHAFWNGYGISLFNTTRVFMIPLTALFWLFGSHRFLGQLLAAVFGAATAGLTARLAREAISPLWALGAGAVVAVFPSQVLWSSVVLRESMVWAGLAAVAVAVACSARSNRAPALIGWATLTFVALLGVGWLRGQTAIVAGWALVPAVALAGGSRRWARVGVAGSILLLAPWIAGQGVAGWSLVAKAAPSLGTTRAYMSLNADSAFVPDAPVDASNCTVQTAGGAGAGAIASRQPGIAQEGDRSVDCIVNTANGAVIAVDNSLDANLSAIPRGLVAFTARPYPWENTTGIELSAARAETVVWLGLYGLTIVGLWACRRTVRVAAYPFLVGVLIAGEAAATQGNLGTAFRHRGQVFWALALFAVIGANHLVTRRRARRSEPAPAA